MRTAPHEQPRGDRAGDRAARAGQRPGRAEPAQRPAAGQGLEHGGDDQAGQHRRRDRTAQVERGGGQPGARGVVGVEQGRDRGQGRAGGERDQLGGAVGRAGPGRGQVVGDDVEQEPGGDRVEPRGRAGEDGRRRRGGEPGAGDGRDREAERPHPRHPRRCDVGEGDGRRDRQRVAGDRGDHVPVVGLAGADRDAERDAVGDLVQDQRCVGELGDRAQAAAGRGRAQLAAGDPGDRAGRDQGRGERQQHRRATARHRLGQKVGDHGRNHRRERERSERRDHPRAGPAEGEGRAGDDGGHDGREREQQGPGILARIADPRRRAGAISRAERRTSTK